MSSRRLGREEAGRCYRVGGEPAQDGGVGHWPQEGISLLGDGWREGQWGISGLEQSVEKTSWREEAAFCFDVTEARAQRGACPQAGWHGPEEPLLHRTTEGHHT